MMKKTHDPFGPFNLSDFKKWMQGQSADQSSLDNLVGCRVEARLPLRRLTDKLDMQDGDQSEAAREFKRFGGTVSEEDGDKVLVEVEAGTFIIPRVYVRKI